MDVSAISWKCFLCLLIFVLLFEQGYTSERKIKCYACEGKKGENCSDSFRSTGIRVMSCNGSCVKVKNEFQGVVSYTRYCNNEYEEERCLTTAYETGPHIDCNCNSDYCNAGTIFQLSYKCLLVMVLFVCYPMMSRMMS